jgi:hypothetical protein
MMSGIQPLLMCCSVFLLCLQRHLLCSPVLVASKMMRHGWSLSSGMSSWSSLLERRGISARQTLGEMHATQLINPDVQSRSTSGMA